MTTNPSDQPPKNQCSKTPEHLVKVLEEINTTKLIIATTKGKQLIVIISLSSVCYLRLFHYTKLFRRVSKDNQYQIHRPLQQLLA